MITVRCSVWKLVPSTGQQMEETLTFPSATVSLRDVCTAPHLFLPKCLVGPQKTSSTAFLLFLRHAHLTKTFGWSTCCRSIEVPDLKKKSILKHFLILLREIKSTPLLVHLVPGFIRFLHSCFSLHVTSQVTVTGTELLNSHFAFFLLFAKWKCHWDTFPTSYLPS